MKRIYDVFLNNVTSFFYKKRSLKPFSNLNCHTKWNQGRSSCFEMLSKHTYIQRNKAPVQLMTVRPNPPESLGVCDNPKVKGGGGAGINRFNVKVSFKHCRFCLWSLGQTVELLSPLYFVLLISGLTIYFVFYTE